MKSAFLTMVWKEEFFLRLWVQYYGGLVGRRNLYVISHGADARTAEIAKGCNLIVIPRDPPDAHFDDTRWALLSDVASGLVRIFDRVVVGDVDELMVNLAPDQSLLDRLEAVQGSITAPAGYELFPQDDALIDEDRPFLQQCFKGVLSGTYSKPCILTEPARISAGGHGSATWPQIDPMLALLHLRFLNTREQVTRRAQRKAIADQATAGSDRDQGAFLRGWRRAEQIRDKIAHQFNSAPEISSAEAPGRVGAILDDARQRKNGIHSFNLRKVRENDVRLVLDPRLRDLF
ncbi:hypothetical protein [Pseudooceanicola aestuarii]|uniref:hypothetical protein n=1 Tax=Pseudooceanicola aestuarii TaxID=2697319 RepID=UPI0013D5229B|nr:hypothetical protein [Pseudooceanicola aestuarii]